MRSFVKQAGMTMHAVVCNQAPIFIVHFVMLLILLHCTEYC